MKRFYNQVAVAPDDEGGYRVMLDGRELRSPAKRRLGLATIALAEAVAAEWDGQAETVEISRMPLMALVSTAADRIGPMRRQVTGELLRYAETDLLCYRAEEPDELVRRQQDVWQPLLDWAAVQHDAPLRVYAGIVPHPQPPESIAALRRAVEAMDELAMAGLSSATAITGSFVIALALVRGHIDAAAAAAASQLDELFQAEIWGQELDAELRRQAATAELLAVERLMSLVRA